MRMEQAQSGIRSGPGVAVKFSKLHCDLQAFFKAFFSCLATLQHFPSSVNETSKRHCQCGLLPAVRELASNGGMAEREGRELWETEQCRCGSI